MKSQVLKVWMVIALLIALVVCQSGCPGGSNVALGLWLMSLDESTLFAGFALLADGQVDEFAGSGAPPGASSIFTGELTWQQNGTEFVLLQDGLSRDRIFNATLHSPTYMTGTWQDLGGPSSSGFFVATKAPVN